MFTRYRNLTLLGVVILAQLLLLAYQVRRPDAGGVRLLRLWTIRAIVPVARATHSTVAGTRALLHDYVMLRGARQEEAGLRARLQAVELENMQLRASAQPVAQLDALLHFRVPVIDRVLPVQVIGGSASPDSQVIYLNRGVEAGLARNMPVLTPGGVVGKITQVFPGAAEVLLLTDPESGIGAMLAENHVHGILWGMGPDRAGLRFVTGEEKVSPGMHVVTSGEDQIFPRGLVLGTVSSVRAHQPFQVIEVRPQVDLAQIEDVLVATRIAAEPAPAAVAGLSAAQLHDQRLPKIPVEPFNPTSGPPPMIADLLAARQARAQQAKPALPPAATDPAARGGKPATAAHPLPSPPRGSAAAKPALPPAGGAAKQPSKTPPGPAPAAIPHP